MVHSQCSQYPAFWDNLKRTTLWHISSKMPEIDSLYRHRGNMHTNGTNTCFMFYHQTSKTGMFWKKLVFEETWQPDKMSLCLWWPYGLLKKYRCHSPGQVTVGFRHPGLMIEPELQITTRLKIPLQTFKGEHVVMTSQRKPPLRSNP